MSRCQFHSNFGKKDKRERRKETDNEFGDSKNLMNKAEICLDNVCSRGVKSNKTFEMLDCEIKSKKKEIQTLMERIKDVRIKRRSLSVHRKIDSLKRLETIRATETKTRTTKTTTTTICGLESPKTVKVTNQITAVVYQPKPEMKWLNRLSYR